MGLWDAVNPSNILSGEALGGALTGAGTGFMMGGPMGALAGAGAGAGMGAMKAGEGKRAEERDRILAAATQQFSPWTGLQAGPIRERDEAGSAMQGAVTGATMYGIGKLGAPGAPKPGAEAPGVIPSGVPAGPGMGPIAPPVPPVAPTVNQMATPGYGVPGMEQSPWMNMDLQAPPVGQQDLMAAANPGQGVPGMNQNPWMNMQPNQQMNMVYNKPGINYPATY